MALSYHGLNCAFLVTNVDQLSRYNIYIYIQCIYKCLETLAKHTSYNIYIYTLIRLIIFSQLKLPWQIIRLPFSWLTCLFITRVLPHVQDPHEEEDESSESDSNSEDELRTGIPSAPNGDSVGFIVDLAKDNGDLMEYHGYLSIFTPLRVGWPPTPQVYFGPWEGLRVVFPRGGSPS